MSGLFEEGVTGYEQIPSIEVALGIPESVAELRQLWYTMNRPFFQMEAWRLHPADPELALANAESRLWTCDAETIDEFKNQVLARIGIESDAQKKDAVQFENAELLDSIAQRHIEGQEE